MLYVPEVKVKNKQKKVRKTFLEKQKNIRLNEELEKDLNFIVTTNPIDYPTESQAIRSAIKMLKLKIEKEKKQREVERWSRRMKKKKDKMDQ